MIRFALLQKGISRTLNRADVFMHHPIVIFLSHKNVSGKSFEDDDSVIHASKGWLHYQREYLRREVQNCFSMAQICLVDENNLGKIEY